MSPLRGWQTIANSKFTLRVIAILLVAEHFFEMWGLILGVPMAIYLIRVVILNDTIPGVYEPESPADPITETEPEPEPDPTPD